MVVIPGFAQQMPGTQTFLRWVPVFAFGETGMTKNYWRVYGGFG